MEEDTAVAAAPDSWETADLDGAMSRLLLSSSSAFARRVSSSPTTTRRRLRRRSSPRPTIRPRRSTSSSARPSRSPASGSQKMRQQSHETGRAAAIPIIVRQLEAIIRLSESPAKMRLTSVATPEHIEEAFRLFNVSTVDAARSGINEHLNLSPKIANEIKQAEAQIKRRMGIGSHISE